MHLDLSGLTWESCDINSIKGFSPSKEHSLVPLRKTAPLLDRMRLLCRAITIHKENIDTAPNTPLISYVSIWLDACSLWLSGMANSGRNGPLMAEI